MTTARRPSLRPTLPAVALALTLAASLAVVTAATAAAAKPVPQFEPTGTGRCLPGSSGVDADATFRVTEAKGRWGHVDARYSLSGGAWTALPGHPARMDVSNGWIGVSLADVPVDAQAISFQVRAVDRKGRPAGTQGWVESGPFECWSPAG